jgi:hypothetical protein
VTATAWNWLLTIVGTVASLAGVVLSWLAWTQAKGAKKAAEEAARAVRTKETANDFARMATNAKSLLEAVQSRLKEKAIVAATDLIHLLLLARNRRANFLPEGFQTQISVDHLQIISSSLAAEGLPDSPQKIQKLLRRCHEIHNSLCGIAATVERTLEETE